MYLLLLYYIFQVQPWPLQRALGSHGVAGPGGRQSEGEEQQHFGNKYANFGLFIYPCKNGVYETLRFFSFVALILASVCTPDAQLLIRKNII